MKVRIYNEYVFTDRNLGFIHNATTEARTGTHTRTCFTIRKLNEQKAKALLCLWDTHFNKRFCIKNSEDSF